MTRRKQLCVCGHTAHWHGAIPPDSPGAGACEHDAECGCKRFTPPPFQTAPKRYRKKPVEVEAVQWTGENREEVEAFSDRSVLLRDGAALHSHEAIRGDWIVRSDEGAFHAVPTERFQATYEEVADGDEGEKTGAELIAAERERQVSEEGWTPEHDDQHTRGELAKAGAVYAMPANGSWKASEWPFEPDSIKHDWNTAEGRLRELARAGALIAAEIDRLQRAALSQHTTSEGGSDDV